MPESIITISELDSVDTAPNSSYIPIDNGTTTCKITVENFNTSSSATATSQALKSEGYAVGKQNGTDVTSGSPYYQNNAKYYKEQAAISASSAADSYAGVLQNISAAAESASAAETAASAAAGSATQASNSKDAAAVSAAAAAASQTAAGGSATSANNSATSAAASAADALSYKDAALGYKNDAAASASYVESATVHPAYIGDNFDWFVWDAENEVYVDSGVLASGNPGISPAVTITPISSGTRVTITDAAHPSGQSFDVLNGTGAGDMIASTYDPNGDVATAGGIAAYIDDVITDALSASY